MGKEDDHRSFSQEMSYTPYHFIQCIWLKIRGRNLESVLWFQEIQTQETFHPVHVSTFFDYHLVTNTRREKK